MTDVEARLFKRIIRERVNVNGNCKVFSKGWDGCSCALCQIDNMDSEAIRAEVEAIVSKGVEQVTLIERQAFISR